MSGDGSATFADHVPMSPNSNQASIRKTYQPPARPTVITAAELAENTPGAANDGASFYNDTQAS